jgi:hypothetical protein
MGEGRESMWESASSDEHLVMTESGTLNFQTVRRLPAGLPFQVEAIENSLQVSVPSAPARQRMQVRRSVVLRMKGKILKLRMEL